MTQYVIPRTDICMSDPMPFSQHWEVRIPVTIDMLGSLGAALQNSYMQFKPGDLVQVAAFTDKDFKRLLEVADFRIVSCNARTLEAVQITETVRVPAVLPENDPASQQNLVIKEVRGAFEVNDQLGNTLDAFVDKKQAQAFIDSYRKITAPAKPATVQDRSGWQVRKSVNGKWTVRDAEGALIQEFSRREEADTFIVTPQKAA